MRHRVPDRVPVMCQLSIGHYNLNAGYKPHKIWYDTEAFADATVKLARRYGFDGTLVVLTGRPHDYLDQVDSIHEESEGEWIRWKDGDRTFLPWDDMPHHFPADFSKPTRAVFEDFDPDRDIHSIDGYLGHIWNALYHIQSLPEKDYGGPLLGGRIPDYFFRAFDAVRSRCPDLSIHGSVYSPLTHFFEIFGCEEALIGLRTDPARAHAVLDLLTEGVVAWALGLLAHGADALDLSSAFVGAPFLSRAQYREFVAPYEKRVNQAIRGAGGVCYTHTCGRIGDRLDLLAETATMGIDTLDPPPLGNCELSAAKRDFGSQLFFKGNMNSVELLHMKTAGEVTAHATDRIRTGMPGAGYILSTACSVAPRVEPWKLELLRPLAEEIGRY